MEAKPTQVALYNVQIPTTIADRAFITQPYPISDLISQKVLHSMAATEPERYKALERAGFKVDPYGSLVFHLQDRLGGHYMDVGVSAKIADGSVCYAILDPNVMRADETDRSKSSQMLYLPNTPKQVSCSLTAKSCHVML